MSKRSQHLHERRLHIKTGDEFYTRFDDIVTELSYYGDIFRNKIVYSNCDKPNSNFVKYFSNSELGLKDYIHSSNDFRSDESIRLLNQADIVVSNPPFSLFVSYFQQLVQSGKKFIIVCPLTATFYCYTLREIIPGRVFTGRTKLKNFIRPDGSTAGVACRWLQNIKRHYNPPIPLHTADPRVPNGGWQRYLNYRTAYNLDRVDMIPDFYTTHPGYMGKIGVPVTYIDKWNPAQFKLVTRTDRLTVTPNKLLFTRFIISTNQNARVWDSPKERHFTNNFHHPNGKRVGFSPYPPE